MAIKIRETRANWTETDPEKEAFILNKPTIRTGGHILVGNRYSRGSITAGATQTQLEQQCIASNAQTLPGSLQNPTTTNITPPDADNYILRYDYAFETPTRLTKL